MLGDGKSAKKMVTDAFRIRRLRLSTRTGDDLPGTKYSNIYSNMPTTVHIPAEVLDQVDAQARKRKLSRNKYIVQALVATIAAERSQKAWPESFFDDMRLWRNDEAHVRAANELLDVVKKSRRSKKAFEL